MTLAGEPRALASSLAPILSGRLIAVLTGAGVSTESGIPDYRSPEASARRREPIQGPDFMRSPATRQRYWARAMAGWERFRCARPGPAHEALARLESRGRVTRLVTQNVDRLHQAAGSRNVIELHGALAEVVCITCGGLEDRDAYQVRLRAANPPWSYGAGETARAAPDGDVVPAAPDGDADLPDEAVRGFAVPPCLRCGGALRPRVVLFGENVARSGRR